MSPDKFISRLIKMNFYSITRSIFSDLSGDDIFNLFLASEDKTMYLNGDFWHSTQTPENCIIWNKIKEKRCISLEEMKRKGDLQLTDVEIENLLCLLTNADYHQLKQHTSNHKKTSSHEELTLVLPEFTNSNSQSIWVNDNLVAVVSCVPDTETLDDESCKPSLGMSTVLLFDDQTFRLVNAISVRGDDVDLLLPKKASDSVVIRCTIDRALVLILWDATGTGKVLKWSRSLFHLPSRRLYLTDTPGIFNTLPIQVFLETEYGRTYCRKMLENNNGNILDIDRFTLDKEARSLCGRKKMAWFADGNEFHCVAGLSRTKDHGYFLHSCQIRSKRDFSLVKTVRVRFSSSKRPASGLEVRYWWPYVGVIYLLGDRFLIIVNRDSSSYEVRSIETMALVHVFNLNRRRLRVTWLSAKVENGFLMAKHTNDDQNFVFVWRLPDDLLEQCDRCLQAGTVGSTELLWEREIETLMCTGSNELKIDDCGVSYYFSDYTTLLKITTFPLPLRPTSTAMLADSPTQNRTIFANGL